MTYSISLISYYELPSTGKHVVWPIAALDVRFLPFAAAIDECVMHTIHGAKVSRWSLCGLKLRAIWVQLHILLSSAMEDWPLLYLSSR